MNNKDAEMDLQFKNANEILRKLEKGRCGPWKTGKIYLYIA